MADHLAGQAEAPASPPASAGVAPCSGPSSSPATADEAGLHARRAALLAAVNARDGETALELVHPEWELRLGDGAFAGRYSDLPGFLRQAVGAWTGLWNSQVAGEAESIRIEGETAHVVSQVALTFRFLLSIHHTVTVRCQETWERDEGRWRLTALVAEWGPGMPKEVAPSESPEGRGDEVAPGGCGPAAVSG